MSTPLTFLGLGAYKSGTTSLQRYFLDHQDIYTPGRGEPSFFATGRGADVERPRIVRAMEERASYLDLFASVGTEKAVGEISPEYLASSNAAVNIRENLPDVRLLAILRNPIRRAYSDYLMNRRLGREPCASFASALDEQEQRARRREPTGYYVSTGYYGRQLSRYYELFPRDQIGTWLFEDLTRDTQPTLDSICRFLGVDPARGPEELPHHNVGGVPRNRLVRTAFRLRPTLTRFLRPVLPRGTGRRIVRMLQGGLHRPALSEESRSRLADIYREDIDQLAQLIGRDLSHWLEPRQPRRQAEPRR